MVSPEIVVLSVFITPCTNPTSIHAPPAGLRARHHRSKQASAGRGRLGGLGVVAGDRVVDQPPQQIGVARGRRVLEGAHPQVAGATRASTAPGSIGVAHGPARRWRPPPARVVGMPSAVHRLADHVLAQHRADRRPCRRRRGRTACAPSPSGAGRAAARAGRSPRRAAAPGRRPAGASSRRTGGRRRPSRPA
jgi:hypothetical protein